MIVAKSILGQSIEKFPNFNQYKKWGIQAAATSYDKATICLQYGEYTFENFRTLGWSFGFEYDFYPEKQWSFQTGLSIAKEPVYNILVEIPDDELFTEGYGGVSDRMKGKGAYSLTVPLVVSVKKRLSNKLYGHLIGGLRFLYYKTGSVSTTVTYSNEDESRQIFGMRLTTQEFEYYGGFIIGTGVLWTAKKFLLKTNVVYVMNFQPIMIGEYQFANLEISEPTRGNYTLSGNYLALSFTFHFNKPKNNWE